MPYVTSIGTQVPRNGVLSPEIRGSCVGIGVIGYEGVGFAKGMRGRTYRIRCHEHRWGDRHGAQISLVHNGFRPAAVSAVTILEGATDGAG